MANFVATVDPDPGRRSQFIQTIQSLLPPVEGLVTHSCSCQDFYACWAAHPSAPVSSIASPAGAAVVWGDVILPGESTRMDARGLRTLWQQSPHPALPPFDGFYAAVAYNPYNGLTLATDILGLFPIYYYTHGEVALVASSPELLRYHPLFKAEFNPAGLVGILLTNGLVDGQTLWQNVRRLNAGHALIWQPQGMPKEVQQYEFPLPTDCESLTNQTFSEHLELLDQLLTQTLKRHAPTEQQYTLLLSGGLDSRMLAGFLHRQGIEPVALTLGKRTDLEMVGAWPIFLALDLQLLKITAALPDTTLAQRRAQNELVCTRFEQLAALPLDRNDYDTQPLKPTKTRSLLARWYRLQRRWRKFQRKLGIERRYYFQIYDINNPGWQAVR
jgi:asparagine synthase (glutamine-hydrolysing)